MKDVLWTQLESQLKAAVPAQADQIMATMRAAMADFLAGKNVDASKVTGIPQLNQLLAAIFDPKTASLARGLVAFDPAAALATVSVPVLVYNGMHDIQIDPDLDAKRLEKARKDAGKDVTLVLSPEANHVLKHETKSIPELRADLVAVQTGYNSPDIQLDDATVKAIVDWLAKHATSRS
jgi:pimeloyl-ACP methyl ester carboxylesterase